VIETIKALDELPEEQRQAILLVSAGGMTYQEAALALEIPIGTLMSRLARGRAALRSLTAAQEHPSRPHLKIVR
jgi:RNA polymerase sigma-70 factor (ECF subfamily)